MTCMMCRNNLYTAIAYCGLTPVRRAARLIIRSLRSTNPIKTIGSRQVWHGQLSLCGLPRFLRTKPGSYS